MAEYLFSIFNILCGVLLQNLNAGNPTHSAQYMADIPVHSRVVLLRRLLDNFGRAACLERGDDQVDIQGRRAGGFTKHGNADQACSLFRSLYPGECRFLDFLGLCHCPSIQHLRLLSVHRGIDLLLPGRVRIRGTVVGHPLEVLQSSRGLSKQRQINTDREHGEQVFDSKCLDSPVR